jgi:uncharacterized metal-binding protein YceD (DUF177 family)
MGEQQMGEQQHDRHTATPWPFPVALEDVPDAGESFVLAADADTRAAVARIAALRDLPRLEANFEVRRHGTGGLHVTGRVSATVGQTCVVTLEPLVNEVEEDIDLIFVPRAAAEMAGEAAEVVAKRGDDAEPLIDGQIDLGALAAEFLVLGINPYPRKPGAVFQAPRDAIPDEGPFAVLGALKKDRDAR